MTYKKLLDENYLIEHYNNKPLKEIAEYFNVGKHIVQRRAKEIGIVRIKKYNGKPKYNYNIDYFKVWSHDMAYILGFIFGDGNIYQDNQFSYRLSFSQNTKNKNVLEFIANKLGKDLIVKDRIRFDKRTNKNYYISELRISCLEMIKDLLKLNVCERKTGNEKLPEIPEEFKMSFLCGYHDSDGHLENGKNNGKYHFQWVCMNEQFLLDIQSNICNTFGRVQAKERWFTYTISRKEICQELDKKMTENVSFYLKRKHF